MKITIILLLVLFINNCASTKKAYWCGDHSCINKAEKESYFKKNMVVEVRELNKKKEKKISEFQIIKQEAGKKKVTIKNEKKLSKETLLTEKELAKQVRLEEKRRKKEEKELAKQVRLEEKKAKIKKLEGTKKKIVLNTEIAKVDIDSSNFHKLVEKITKRNMFKPYPDINNIPN